jgi:hypothetical protein
MEDITKGREKELDKMDKDLLKHGFAINREEVIKNVKEAWAYIEGNQYKIIKTTPRSHSKMFRFCTTCKKQRFTESEFNGDTRGYGLWFCSNCEDKHMKTSVISYSFLLDTKLRVNVQ